MLAEAVAGGLKSSSLPRSTTIIFLFSGLATGVSTEHCEPFEISPASAEIYTGSFEKIDERTAGITLDEHSVPGDEQSSVFESLCTFVMVKEFAVTGAQFLSMLFSALTPLSADSGVGHISVSVLLTPLPVPSDPEDLST